MWHCALLSASVALSRYKSNAGMRVHRADPLTTGHEILQNLQIYQCIDRHLEYSQVLPISHPSQENQKRQKWAEIFNQQSTSFHAI